MNCCPWKSGYSKATHLKKKKKEEELGGISLPSIITLVKKKKIQDPKLFLQR